MAPKKAGNFQANPMLTLRPCLIATVLGSLVLLIPEPGNDGLDAHILDLLVYGSSLAILLKVAIISLSVLSWFCGLLRLARAFAYVGIFLIAAHLALDVRARTRQLADGEESRAIAVQTRSPDTAQSNRGVRIEKIEPGH